MEFSDVNTENDRPGDSPRSGHSRDDTHDPAAAAREAALAASSAWRRHVRSTVDPVDTRCVLAASYTAHRSEPGLGTTLLAAGSHPAISVAEANQIFQLCLDPESFGAADADDVVVLWRIEDLFERDLHAWANGDPDALTRLVDGVRSLGSAVAGLAERITGSVVLGDATVPVGFGFDHDDPEELHQLATLQQQLNVTLDAAVGTQPRIDRLRVSALQARHGTASTFDRRGWMLYRQPHPDWFAHAVGVAAGQLIAGRRRVAPKVVVLDCDDTLWSGIAVDDGVGGLAAGDAFPGRAHQEFQRALQRLRHRGVMLALCSKNDPATVVDAFRDVDGMVLTDDDIAARRVSWDPKPGGIAAIADELHIGLDAVVFVDDSPFEIASVTTQLPGVRCVTVPEDIEELPDLLAATGWFRGMRVNEDDRERTARILEESKRVQSADAAGLTPEQFLASLDLKVRMTAVGEAESGRVAQLINKTNQFNLTTRRRTPAEVNELLTRNDVVVRAITVDDRFGEYGLVGVVIAVEAADRWELDTVLMSCRVLGRGVEQAMLALLVQELRTHGGSRRHAEEIVGVYLPSGRNDKVADFYPRLGFRPASAATADDGAPQRFVLPPAVPIDVPDHITALRQP